MKAMYLAVLATCVAGSAAAQTEPRRDPRDATAAVPRIEYRSPFAGYRPYAESELASWVEANDAMRRLGGHAGHSAKPPAKPPADARKEQPKP